MWLTELLDDRVTMCLIEILNDRVTIELLDDRGAKLMVILM
jgi:hypothetical protein